MEVPFFRPSISGAEIAEVTDCLKSGWLTSGPRVKQFETEFGHVVGARHAVAVSSCTAALHLAVDALGLRPGQAVLIPTMTFAATAEVVRYQGAVPVLVDCDPITLNMDLEDAQRKIFAVRAAARLGANLEPVGVIPVHVGGLMMDIEAVAAFAEENDLWVVEDAAHAFPASFRRSAHDQWIRCGENTAAVTCFSFYSNKTITTGEGGMAVTNDQELAERMRCMSLHGLSHDAWNRFRGNGNWDYRIVAPGFKYNLTDIAACLGIHQLKRAEAMRVTRELQAEQYFAAFEKLEQLELPRRPVQRIHAWHLFPIQLRLENLTIDRDRFLEELRGRGVGCSVHWRPLHLHPYYMNTYGWRPHELPAATAAWQRLISLPLFPDMRKEEQQYVIDVVWDLCETFGRSDAARQTAKRSFVTS